VGLAQEQWRLFFGEGRFDKNHPDKSLAPIIGAANRLQMARWQVVGQFKSWVANRANEFIRCVRRSSLSDEDKHLLLRVNACEAWFSRSPLATKSGELIPDHLRRLARSIMRHCMSRHRRPDLAHTNMVLDQRAATLAPSRKNNSFALWLRLSTMEPGERIEAPLVSYAHFEGRKGLRALSVQVNQDRETGRIRFGVITNIAGTCRQTRADYTPQREQLALDFGLSTLLAADDGGLFGQGWLKALNRYDQLIASIAKHVQRSGGKPRQSRRYRKAVAGVRGLIRSEIGRLMNRLVEMKKPARLVVERLNFQHPQLSARMNRLLQNCGRRVFREKLIDLEQRFGITTEEINPAYTSQSCCRCGYPDKRNRRSQAKFTCLWCGHVKHADVNAGCNIKERRSLPIGSVWVPRRVVLSELVRRFCARWPVLRDSTGSRGAPADPRIANPYFAAWISVARSPPVPRRTKSVVDQA
jgi:putative transposase